MTPLDNIQKKIDKLLIVNSREGLSDNEQKIFNQLFAFKVGFMIKDSEKAECEQTLKQDLPELYEFYLMGLGLRNG